jgi:saccharopine dehydrogenase (NAD+, L-lysine-forming)
MILGLIKEGKIPSDTRVLFTPKQCKEIQIKYPQIKIIIQPSTSRCYADSEYINEGLTLSNDLSQCDILLGIKEVPIDELIPNKTYFFFSHTKKKQPYNQELMQALIAKNIRMIDYECLTYEDGQRILGFGFFAGIVGAHNSFLTYGKKTGDFKLPAAHELNDYSKLLNSYQGLKLPPLKIVITGSGKVTSGVLEVLSHLDVQSIEPNDYLNYNYYNYPVYTHLKGGSLYQRIDGSAYIREDFHKNPQLYKSTFKQFVTVSDILINGIYWDKNIPRLFESKDIQDTNFKINVIGDITCDIDGSVPINLGATSIDDPVYGVDKHTISKTLPYQNTTEIIDIMAVDNLPNELPRDASEYFGAHFEKYVLEELIIGYHADIINRATICADGKLLPNYEYLSDYAY